MNRLARASFLSCLILSACEKGDIPGFEEPRPGAGISFTSPDDGDEIASSSVFVKVETNGVTLAPDAIGGPAVDGEGHYHFYVDGAAAGEGAGNSFLVTDLLPGTHEITARLFSNDHQPISGASPASVRVAIPASAPRVSIVSPDDGALVNSSSVELTVQWENYSSGRWHAYVDALEGDPRGVAENPTSMVTRLAPGVHEVFVRLHHSDGTPFEPEVVDVVTVEVPAGAPSVRIVDPEYGSIVPRDTPMRVEAENFDIDGNEAGGENQAGQGHFHVYIDGYDSGHMWQEGYWNDVVVDGAPVGTREIFVRLMNNDHTSIEPKVVDRVEVVVES